MFLIIISTFLRSISDVLYKKSVAVSDIKPTVFQFIWELFAIPFIIGIIFYGFNFKLFLNPLIITCFILIIIMYILYENVWLSIYKEEKLSTLLPYWKINNFIIVISGFLFFRDSSFLSFWICLWAIILTTISSIDFKNHELPKNFWKIMLYETLKALELMLEIYILKKITTVEYVLLYQVIYTIFTFFVILYIKELNEFKKFKWEVVRYRSTWATIWVVAWGIELFLLKELWVVIATLLWFFWSSLSIIIAYFFLKEVPQKKEIILWIIMIFLAWLWYFYR